MMVVQPARFSNPTCAVDPFAANRVFFLRGQGADGATPSTDDLGTNALTWGAGAAISTAGTPKWSGYGSVARVNGADGSRFSTATGAPKITGTNPWTVSFWLYLNSAPPNPHPVFTTQPVFTTADGVSLEILPDRTARFFAASAMGAWAIFNGVSVLSAIPLTTWVELRFCRNGGSWHFMQAGTLETTLTSSASISSSANPASFGGVDVNSVQADFADAAIYNVATHTASYTTATLPPC